MLLPSSRSSFDLFINTLNSLVSVCCKNSRALKMAEDTGRDDRTWDEKMYWDQFSCLGFCQFLRSGFEQRLAIPETFTRNLREKLPEIVGVRGPSGDLWEVGVTAINDTLFLDLGWQEFARAHLLEENDILIFKCSNGEPGFKVLIFDGQTSCEKESSYFVRKCTHTIASSNNVHEVSQEKKGGATIKPISCVLNERIVSEEEKENALQLAQGAVTNDGFLVVMKPSHVYRRFFMTIPSEWVSRHLSVLQNQDVFLRFKENTWRTRFNYQKSRNNGGLSSGWKNFSLANHLHEFDVCVFEPGGLMNNSMVLDVNVFRVVHSVTPLSQLPIKIETLLV